MQCTHRLVHVGLSHARCAARAHDNEEARKETRTARRCVGATAILYAISNKERKEEMANCSNTPLPNFRIEIAPPVQSMNVEVPGMKCQARPSNRLLRCQKARPPTKQPTGGMNTLGMICFGHLRSNLKIRNFCCKRKRC